LVRSTSGRGVSSRHGAALVAQRSRSDLRRGLSVPRRQHGNLRDHLGSGESVAEPVRRAPDRIDATRVSSIT
jgi:hypothetical protein